VGFSFVLNVFYLFGTTFQMYEVFSAAFHKVLSARYKKSDPLSYLPFQFAANASFTMFG
jgi:hypothetical protein